MNAEYHKEALAMVDALTTEEIAQGLKDAGICAAPAAAQLDADSLPPLPEPYASLMRLSGGYEDVFIAEQYRQGQRDAQVAALAKYCGADAGGTQLITRLMTEVNDLRAKDVEYAERIRLLTEELATFKAEHATDQEPKP